MVKFYVTQIQLGNITLADVPEMWCHRVEQALKQESLLQETASSY